MAINSIILVVLGIADSAMIVGGDYSKSYCRTSGQARTILLYFQANLAAICFYLFKKRLEDPMYHKFTTEIVLCVLSLILAIVFSLQAP